MKRKSEARRRERKKRDEERERAGNASVGRLARKQRVTRNGEKQRDALPRSTAMVLVLERFPTINRGGTMGFTEKRRTRWVVSRSIYVGTNTPVTAVAHGRKELFAT